MSIMFELERMERLILDIDKLRIRERVQIIDYKMQCGNAKDGYFCSTESWMDYKISTPWSELDRHRWFRTQVVIPEEMDGKHVEFMITTGREGQWDATNPQMLFYINQEIVQGIDVNHRSVTLSMCAKAGEKYDIAMCAYSGSVEGDLIFHTEIAVVDDIVESFYYDFSVPVNTARLLNNSDKDNSRKILVKLNEAANLIDLRKPYSKKFYASILQAGAMLANEFYTEEQKNAEVPVVSAIGHTHIDIAWLWTVNQTREKVLRSFSTVLRLMEQYPDYKFMSSQPILYYFVKKQEPELYARIKERVKEGRWEVDGAMWLEADCNLPSGESLVRQILKGEKFIQEEFGKKSKSLWLPDVFGYSAAIPQILKLSGIPYFSTTKIAWNQYNQLPNDTFNWRGIDGSEVFVFMPTACDFDKSLGLNISFTDTRNTTTYTGIINPNMTLGTYKRFNNKDLTEDTIMLFGYGDGGGGPTKEMLENAKRLEYAMPGIPKIKQEFEQDFYDRTYEKIAKNPAMPTWDGELYFEYHRGTYTSLAKNKRYNRKGEIAYGQLEILATMARKVGYEYPVEVIEEGWDILLLNQFHDIIPGTAIGEVYEQTDIEYDKILKDAEAAIANVTESLVSYIDTEVGNLVVFNTLGYVRDDIVTIGFDGVEGVGQIVDEEGVICPIQRYKDGKVAFIAKGIPAVGYKVFKMIYKEMERAENVIFDGTFENLYYRIEFNDQMEIVSLIEKETELELIKEGRVGNQLITYEDRPMNWDNWDLDVFYQKKQYFADSVSEIEVVEVGALETRIRTTYRFEESVITQDVCLYNDVPRIDFKTHVDWKEHNTLLRVNFPLDINATKATYEIQYGNVERETTNNHSWDTAKFETCAHKWVDLSENGVGFSMLNDCKYGHSVKDGEMGLTLIKAGQYPYENADIETHEFIYSIYPHANRWQEADTVRMAYNLNVPMIVKQKVDEKEAILNSVYSMVTVDKENCFIEAIKRAEDRSGDVIRIYENKNQTTKVKMKLSEEYREVYECDLLENIIRPIDVNDHEIEFRMKGFEIKTFKLVK